MAATIKSPPVYRIALYQFLIITVLAAMLLIKSPIYSFSVWLGGLICIIPSAYFARLAFRYRGAQASTKVARSMYLGEAGKFTLTAALFAIVFILVNRNTLTVNIAVLFASYGLTVIVGLVCGQLVLKRK